MDAGRWSSAKRYFIIFVVGCAVGALGSGVIVWRYSKITGGTGYADVDRVAEQLEDLEQEHGRTIANLETTVEQQRREVEYLRGNIAEAKGLIGDAGRVCESIIGASGSEEEIIDAAIKIASQVYSQIKSADRVLGDCDTGVYGGGDVPGL
jgi:hypothetical protein